MASERFSLTVLPVSVDPARAFHVSLHIAPRLTPSAGKNQLGDFPLFSQWGNAITGDAWIRLFDQDGAEIASKPLLAKIDPRLWPSVFPETVRVDNQAFDTFKGRDWRTFAAKTVHDAAMATQFVSFLSSPDKPPLPSVYPFTRPVVETAEGSMLPPRIWRRSGYDESAVTKRLSSFVGKDGRPKPTGNAMLDVLLALYEARRYYEQSVKPGEYHPQPIGEASKPLARPAPDFHHQVGYLGDQSELLRRLGLVIDLQVTDLARLGGAAELYADIDLKGFPGVTEQIRTPIHRVGTNLLTVPATKEWQDGALKLGDAERFAVLILDADGSALKLDRFFWTLPRLLWVEFNGDPVHAAPPAMRVGGLTVVQNGNLDSIQTQLGRTEDQLAKRSGGNVVRVSTEDVTRGFRVEVWDDIAGSWFSLHERLIETSVDGFGKVFDDIRSTGFIQTSGVTQSPVAANDALHAHEALFGWSGWSLSAPRPGPRVRHDAGNEIVEPTTADPSPVTPVHTSSRVAPGTLPRLRYGRSYAFRAWSVDLAGNSPPHPLPLGGLAQPFDFPQGPGPVPEAMQRHQVVANNRSQPQPSPVLLDRAAAILARHPHKAELPAATVKAMKIESRRILSDQPRPDILSGRVSEVSDKPITGVAEVDALVRARISTISRSGANTVRPVDIAARMLREVAESDAAAEPIAELAAHQLAAMVQADTSVLAPELIAAMAALRETITPLVPYYRWEPVSPPVVVARASFSQAESIRHLVIRSGVELSAPVNEGGTISIDEPAAYAALMAAAHPELVLNYRASSERHLAPPKGSLEMAELHGMMDAAIGSTDPIIRKRHLAIALRDDGTLLDRDVVDASDPALRHPQPGVSLAGPEVAEPPPKNLDELKRGEALTPGQYVVHDVDDLVLPYLPDPLSHGLAMVFPDAGKDRGLPPILAVEGVAARYPGGWPNLEPFRLVLESSPQLTGKVNGRVITIGMPPGTKLNMRLSSTMTKTGLDVLGLWRLLPQALRDSPLLYEAAIRGWFWAFTPTEEVTLVHAVPRPLEPPRATILLPFRGPGDTEARLIGALDCHGPSTDRIDAEANWTEWIDDLAQPGPTTEVRNSVAFTTTVATNEDLVVLAKEDETFNVPGYGPWRLHGSKHQFNDTKHRLIDYAFRATTRFREYFPPSVMDDPDQRSVLGATRTISMPSTVRPPAPLIHSVLPLFRWEEETEPNQPFAVRRRRRAGFRIYIERPWYASGEGELLGVLVAPAGNEMLLGNHASQWGADPVWLQAGPKLRAIYLELTDLLHLTGFDDRPGAARPVAPPALLPLREANGNLVQVLGYRPEYQPDRKKWFVDVAIDPGTAVWPFVRLAVVRYQPDSLPDCFLSPLVHCVFTQLTLERTATLSRPDVDHARLVVSGPVGFRVPAEQIARRAFADPAVIADFIRDNRRFLARLQKRDPAIPTDLGWHTEVVTELGVVGFDPTDGEIAWMGMLDLPEPIDPARPGAVADWRVTVEEWEALEADPVPFRGDKYGDPLTKEWRIVYADHLSL